MNRGNADGPYHTTIPSRGISGAADDWTRAGERRLPISSELAGHLDGDLTSVRLCELSKRVTGVTGAGIIAHDR